MLNSKYILAACLLLLVSCVGGDDDGRRLGEIIVGTWQRGWNEGDVVIEGISELEPENIIYDKFEFLPDGSYNGMVRNGSFHVTDTKGETAFAGTYQCDNNNIKLHGSGSDQQVILARVLSFTDDTIQLSYVNESYHVTITVILRKLSD